MRCLPIFAVLICLLALAGCGGGSGSYNDGSEGRAFRRSQAEAHNSQAVMTGAKAANPVFY